ncbi:MAG: DEAD/DEAH box helicase [Paracoccaceae bacterium]
MTDITGVHPALAQALQTRGYEVLTPVQLAMLAPELSDADALVSAQTGSGKTVAFGMSIAPTLLGSAEKFLYAAAPKALVIAPTRELALQVKRELEWLYATAGARIASCVGGMDIRAERRTLERGAHIVVGTPGRLRDHIERRSLDLSEIRAVVLDEADEMLDLGFRDELEFILGAAPQDRRTLMFSATVPRSIASLASRYQKDAVRVEVSKGRDQHVDITYRAMTIAPNDQENGLINTLRFYEAKNAIVFCNTRATVNHITARLNNRGFKVVALSGELSQNERTHALQAMRDGRAQVCVATDVAARGIDLPNLELVIHADLPKNRESLLHRSGRTGRAGRKGVSVLLVPFRSRRRTERLLQGANVTPEWSNPPSAEEVLKRDDERLLADPVIGEALNENDAAFGKKLLELHSAEQLAGALVRLFRKDKSAPEELRDPGKSDPKPERGSKPRGRNDFENGVWFSLSIGHKQKAEPRWLLPMLAKNGKLNRGDIGAIKILQNVTYVELTPKCVPRFLKTIGPTMKLEKTMTLTQLDGLPEVVKDDDTAPRKPHRGQRDDAKKPRHKKTKTGKFKPDGGGGQRKKPKKPKKTKAS